MFRVNWRERTAGSYYRCGIRDDVLFLSLWQPGNPNLALRVPSLDATYLVDRRLLTIEFQHFTRKTYVQMAMPVRRAIMRYDLVFQFFNSELILDKIS
jgi:hypothetical protein